MLVSFLNLLGKMIKRRPGMTIFKTKNTEGIFEGEIVIFLHLIFWWIFKSSFLCVCRSVTRWLDFCYIWPLAAMKICPMAYKVFRRKLKILPKTKWTHSKWPKFLTLHQSGEFLPNLVTLVCREVQTASLLSLFPFSSAIFCSIFLLF